MSDKTEEEQLAIVTTILAEIEAEEVELALLRTDTANLRAELTKARDRIDDAYHMGERLRPMIEEFREISSCNDSDMYFEAFKRMEKAADELAQIATVLLGVKS